jgi:hypothetical protein
MSSGSGGGSGGGGTPPTQSRPSLDPSMVAALINIIQSGASPEILGMQKLLLERLIMEGDVIPSRIPPPLNITEVGGYINLLSGLGRPTLEIELISSALGIAPPVSMLAQSSGHPLSMVSMPEDRPAGSLQPTIPLSWYARSDFSGALTSALQSIHSQGGLLPLLSPLVSLPSQGTTGGTPDYFLPLIGRGMNVLPTVALNDPTTDPVVLAGTTSGGPYKVMVAATGSGAPAAAQWYALAWSGTTLTEVSIPSGQFIDIGPALASAGFYAASPLPKPVSSSDITWSKLTNITGLVPGVTTLQSELSLLHSANAIGASGLAAYLNYVWDGTTFSPPSA